MTDKTKIEWTDATWNPVTGCTKVSPGCDHCYAETFAERWRGTPGHYFEHGFDVQLRPDKLDQPLRWRRPRRIFVNSMSDLFHDDVSDDYIARVFVVMALAGQHTFQLLTKRHGRMRSLLNDPDWRARVNVEYWTFDPKAPAPEQPWPLPNVWLGVSVENQQWADIRIPALLDTPAAVRFLSCEPLLGPVDLTYDADPTTEQPVLTSYLDGIDWVIVGGESGRGARPMHPDWARSLRDQSQAAGVAFHFKQWGEHTKVEIRDAQPGDLWVLGENGMTMPWRPDTKGAEAHAWGPYRDELMRRVGKKAAGRELDGRTWNDFPAQPTTHHNQ